MKDIDLSSMINLAYQILEILESEYQIFFKKDKLSNLLNIDLNKLFKVINKEYFLGLYFEGDTYYLNLNFEKEIKNLQDTYKLSSYLKSKNLEEIFKDLTLFLLLNLICGEINPLKMAFIELECQRLSKTYNLPNSPFLEGKELEIANLLKESVLKDLPFNIIFLENDTEIFYYLAEEKGIRIAKLYYEISLLMKEKYQNIKTTSLEEYLKFYDNLNYDNILDIIYDFINTKIR